MSGLWECTGLCVWMTFLGFVLEASSFLKMGQWTSFCFALLSKDDPHFQPSSSTLSTVFLRPSWQAKLGLSHCPGVIGRQAGRGQRGQPGTDHRCHRSSEPYKPQVSSRACFPQAKLEQHTSQSHQQQKCLTTSADSQPGASDPGLQTAWML